jgi:hypothetical protein
VQRDFFLRAFKVTAETVNAIMTIPTETKAALLNSGTFGVEVEPVEVEVPVLDVGAEVGLDVDVPLADITARLPIKPSVEPPSLIAYIVFVPES